MLEKLNEYYEKGLLRKQDHPTLDLTVWNYSAEVQYSRAWDEITMLCRGLVTNSKGEIVARAFRKFFNYEEYGDGGFDLKLIPNESFEVYEKMDGMLIILFYYQDTWVVASRGSFISDASIKARELLGKYNLELLDKTKTYAFELISFGFKIVIDYPFEDLVMLACFDAKTGDEIDIQTPLYMDNFRVVKRYNGIADYHSLKSTITDDQEGRVVRFKSGFRMKMKGTEYLRLHRIVTQVSNIDIWEHLKDGIPLTDILDNVPDEFYSWVTDTVDSLTSMFEITKNVCEQKFYNTVSTDMTRKEAAMAILALHRNYHALLFSLYDGRDISEMIWKRLRPKYTRPFLKQKDDEEFVEKG